MRCAYCGDLIESDRDIAWVEGTAICPKCAKKGRILRRGCFTVWAVMAILMMLVMLLVGALVFFPAPNSSALQKGTRPHGQLTERCLSVFNGLTG